MSSDNLRLPTKPAPPDAVVAAVTAAALRLTAVVVQPPVEQPTSSWRFSGRHFGPGHAVRYPRRVR